MRVALIPPPFIPVPPPRYGGTELFVAQLAVGLKQRGIDVVVYTNGESTVPVEIRYLYKNSDWPITGETLDSLKDMNHSSWAVRDASESCDVIHINNAPAVTFARYVSNPFVYTVHHPKEKTLSGLYHDFPQIHYVCISEFQRRLHGLPRSRTIHHGLDLALYPVKEEKEGYLSFIGRIAPMKGPHLAIQVAKRTGIPLKIAGEVQPLFKSYFETEIKPHLDGKFIEFLGAADMNAKNELLGGSRAMLFPIQWDEPFGLVMIEAMACGTPVLALRGGSVPEVVRDGISGYVCRSVEEMADRARTLSIPARQVRSYAEENFSVDAMVDRYIECYREALAAVPEPFLGVPPADEEYTPESKTA